MKKSVHLNIDHLLSKADNKFLLSNAVAGRAKQINDGSLPYVNDFDPTNSIITALKEVAGDKILIKIGKEAAKKAKEEATEKKSDFLAGTAFDRLARNAKVKKTSTAAPKKGKK